MSRPPLTMSAFGMHLHAATTVDGRDRKQLERLCRSVSAGQSAAPCLSRTIARLAGETAR